MPSSASDTKRPLTPGQRAPVSNDFTETLKTLSRRSRGRLLLALQLFRKGDLPRALSETSAIVEEQSGCGLAVFLKSVLLKAVGDTAAASSAAQEAIDAGYSTAHAWLLLANLCVEEGRPQKALATAERAVAADPMNVSAQFTLGRLLIEQGQAESAIPVLEQAATLAPQMAAIHYRLAQARLACGQANRAQEAAEDGLATAPSDFLARLSLGRMLRERGEIERAADEFSAASELPVRNVGVAFAELGKTHLVAGELDRTVDSLQRAVEANPKDYGSLVLLGQIMLDKADLPSAEGWLSAALEVDAKAPEARGLKAQLDQIQSSQGLKR